MRRKLYLFPLFLFSICILITSCNKDDDDTSIDEEWKSLNETRFNEVAADKSSYTELRSQSDNGSVYWKKSTMIGDSDDALRISPSGNPEFTDTVVVRYEGWYFDKTGEKVIFDSSENPSLKSKIAYSVGASSSPYPNKQPLQGAVSGFIDGFSTILQNMQVGDERVVCIPQQLGYGSGGSTYTPVTNGGTYTLIPGYTTLWFDIKLIKIISMSGLS